MITDSVIALIRVIKVAPSRFKTNMIINWKEE